VLKTAGATWADVVKTNTFVTDFDEFQKCADIRMRYLGVAPPTSTTVGVTRLAGPDLWSRSRPSPSLIPERRVRADAGTAARQPQSEEGDRVGRFPLDAR
jgi:enamine deaminase RidA (YjgF/YER057c/UK114 family)